MIKRFWIAATIMIGSIYWLCAAEPSRRDAIQQLQKLNQFYNYLSAFYAEDVDMQPLVEKAIQSMLKELDPHSIYISAEDMKGVTEDFNGKFSGIGIEYAVINDTIVVVNTIAGAPAQRVGIVPNDRIVEIDSKSAIGLTKADVPKYLRGKRGSKVDIKVIRQVKDSLDFTITRANIPIHTVDAAYKLDATTGYIKVNRFGETTMNEFRKSFYKMSDIQNLVVDLRGNGGGLLSEAIDMANFFLPKGSLIVSTEGRTITPRQYTAAIDGDFTKGGVVILVDENSASASEIVSGAIQDWDRGVIVGETTFGKGLVQRQFSFADGSSARITIARYHTPSGRVIQRPYEKGHSEEYFNTKNDAESKKSDAEAKKNSHKTLKLGRTVFGGGGITPDIKLTRDTLTLSPLYSQLIRRGIISEFIIKHLEKERSSLISNYPTQTDFIDSYQVDDKTINALVEYANSKGIFTEEMPKDNVDNKTLLLETHTYIKALLAQKLYNTSAFYQVMNRADTTTFNTINRTISRMKNPINYNFY